MYIGSSGEISPLNKFLDIFEKEIDMMVTKRCFYHLLKYLILLQAIFTKFSLKCIYFHKDLYVFHICEKMFSDPNLNISYLLIVFFLYVFLTFELYVEITDNVKCIKTLPKESSKQNMEVFRFSLSMCHHCFN